MDEGPWRPIAFIGEEIQPSFKRLPILSKKPGVPDGFVWREKTHKVEKLISSWFSYERKGRMAKNLRDANLKQAKRKGSWGVGRYYFRVQVEGGRVFDLYYDRAPKDVDDRQGQWVLWRELEGSDASPNLN
jgi:hypothetical protein